MISYALTLLGISGATLIPAYVALYLISNLKIIHIRYLAAAGLGLSFWFFVETMGDAAYLDVNEGFTGGASHVAMLASFVLGVIVLATFDHFSVPNSSNQAPNQTSKIGTTSSLFLIAAAVASVSGIHGFAEGWSFASVAHIGSGQTLTDAFGGFAALASYPIHKFLEASIVGILYVIYVGRTNLSKRPLWHLPVLGLLFAIPSVIGAAIGYSVSIDTTYFYSFGVTSALYGALRLAEAIHPNFKVGAGNPAYLGGRIFLALILGFLLLYFAALLHG